MPFTAPMRNTISYRQGIRSWARIMASLAERD